ncbi:type IV pilin N-terminal domain-containing protein [Methanocalculus sp. MC3]
MNARKDIDLRKRRDDAVSPVVGVMLMLVVTIIIAAVVSGFAGSLVASAERPPSLNADVKIKNDGTWGGSYFDIIVQGVSEPIPTRDLKLVTSWRKTDGTSGGAEITGPSPPAEPNYVYEGGARVAHAPYGFGPGVPSFGFAGTFQPEQSWGNFSLAVGTRVHNSPYGWNVAYGGYGVTVDSRYEYTNGSVWLGGTDRDALMAILGENWYTLRQGEIVNVKLVHIPTGSTLLDKNVAVEE